MADKNNIDTAYRGMIEAAEGPANRVSAYVRVFEKAMKKSGYKKR